MSFRRSAARIVSTVLATGLLLLASAAGSRAQVDALDVSAIDSCSLLDEATVQQLTGESVSFANQDMGDGISAASCFWAAAVGGVSAYLEVTVSDRGGSLEPGLQGCSISPVDAVGDEAVGASCTDSGSKVYLGGRQNGITVDVLVNEPSRPLTPQDLAPTVRSLLAMFGAGTGTDPGTETDDSDAGTNRAPTADADRAPVATEATSDGVDAAALRAGRPNVITAVPTPGATPWNLASLLGSGLIALFVLLLVVFPSELFNSTLDEHYEEIKAAIRRRIPWWPRSRPILNPDPGAVAVVPRRRGWAGLVAITAASALLYGLLDPAFGPNRASVVLVIGVFVGVAVSTLLSAATTGLLVRRRFGRADYWFRVLPGTLLVAAACVVMSRLVGFLPGYLYGLVGGLAFVQSLDEDDRGRSVLHSSAAVMLAALTGWLVYGPVAEAVDAPSPGLPLVVTESILAGTFIAGVEGLLISLLPLRYLPGETLFRWSRTTWVAVYGTAVFAFVHLLARPAAAEGPSVVSWAKTLTLFLAFGAASVAFWAYWRRRDMLAAGATDTHQPVKVDTG